MGITAQAFDTVLNIKWQHYYRQSLIFVKHVDIFEYVAVFSLGDVDVVKHK